MPNLGSIAKNDLDLEKVLLCLLIECSASVSLRRSGWFFFGSFFLPKKKEPAMNAILHRWEASRRVFLKQIDRETPKALALHLIVDNYCTHKHDNVKQWLSRHPRFHVHFIPTGSSWMNLVERFFADLTADVVREGSFTHVRQLVADIEMYLAQRNASPKPYRWKAQREEILAKIRRAKHAIAQEKAMQC